MLISIDPAIQDLGDDFFTWLTYPCILDSDVAGEVVEVGSDVFRFQSDDRVIDFALSLTNANFAESLF